MIEVSDMPEYEKKGYLVQDFKVFRLNSPMPRPIPPHYHDFHKIILFLDVHGDYIIEGTSYPLGPQDIAFVRAGEIHRPAIDGNSPYERIVIYIAPGFLARVSRPGADLSSCFQRAPGEAGVMRLAAGHSHELLSQMEKLEQTARGDGFANSLYTEALFVEFMILLHRALFSHELGTVKEAAADEKIQPLLGYIENHLADDLSADALAQEAYLSKYYLMRRFKAATGYSLHRYVTMKRLLHARSLLTESPERAITEISTDSGFADYTAFFRAFKAQFSVTPQEWRKLHIN
jgi:AraC-like DNA-binding protein